MTANITVTLTDTSGDPLVGARVNAKLFVQDRLDDFTVPENSNVTGTTDESGKAVLALWPNSANTDINTYYRFRAWHPVTRAKVLDINAVVSIDANLEDLAPPVPSYISLSDVHVLISKAWKSFIDTYGQATEKIVDLGYIADEWDLDIAEAQNYRLILGGDTTLTFSGVPQSDPPTAVDTIVTVVLYVQQDGDGGHTLTIDEAIRWPSGIAHLPDKSPNSRVIYLLMSIDSGQSWDGWIVGNGMA